MIGDPSGRSDLRQVLTLETILENSKRFREQMKILLDFDAVKSFNGQQCDWLLTLNYVDFARYRRSLFCQSHAGSRMLQAAMEKGLTFLEFNYMLMQAYDFLVLYRKYGCQMQLGGDDQWSNILAGVDLVRRKDRAKHMA